MELGTRRRYYCAGNTIGKTDTMREHQSLDHRKFQDHSSMSVHNTEIAEMFSRLARLLEIQGANPFRIRGYQKAGQTIEGLPHSVTSMVAGGTDLSNVMQALSLMNRTEKGPLIVMDENHLVGIVALKVILKFLSLKLDLEGTRYPATPPLNKPETSVK